MRVAHKLEKAGIKVDMAVTIDATVPPTVPTNVSICYNYFQSQALDAIPMFRGMPLTQEDPKVGKPVNMNLRKDRTDLLVDGTNHINIDKNPRVQDEVVQKILQVCPTREAWTAAHRGSTPVLAGATSRPVSSSAQQPKAQAPQQQQQSSQHAQVPRGVE